jgi:hypothetical protein
MSVIDWTATASTTSATHSSTAAIVSNFSMASTATAFFFCCIPASLALTVPTEDQGIYISVRKPPPPPKK